MCQSPLAIRQREALSDWRSQSAEAWTKGLPACRRRYKGSFLSKLNDAEAEAAETQVWLKFAVKCQYLDLDKGRELYSQAAPKGQYQILGLIVVMTNSTDKWLLKKN